MARGPEAHCKEQRKVCSVEPGGARAGRRNAGSQHKLCSDIEASVEYLLEAIRLSNINKKRQVVAAPGYPYVIRGSRKVEKLLFTIV